MAAVGRELLMSIDGVQVPVTVTGSSYHDQALLADGGGAVTIEATADLPDPGRLESSRKRKRDDESSPGAL